MLRSLMLVSAILCSSLIIAQSESDVENETDKFDHYGGVQVNPLLRQVLSFGETEEVMNPYLAVYTLRFNSSNFAISAGFGHSKQRTEDDDGLTATTSDFSVRAGAGQQFKLNEKFELGYAFDLLYSDQTTSTITAQVVDFGAGEDSTYTETKSTESGFGAGLRVNLMFHISESILIGTEASYNYLRSTEKFHFYSENHLSQQNQPPQVTVTSDNEKEEKHNYGFNLPMALYLIIKF